MKEYGVTLQLAAKSMVSYKIHTFVSENVLECIPCTPRVRVLTHGASFDIEALLCFGGSAGEVLTKQGDGAIY